MGVLSGVKDAILGKNYRQDTVLGKTTIVLVERARTATHPFVEEWATECTIAAYSILDFVLCDHHQQGAKAFSKFREHYPSVDQTKAMSLFKLVASDFLIAFKNEVNDSDFENATQITTDEFEHDVLEIFDFGFEDKRLYKELGGLFGRETYTEFSTILYQSALEHVCGPAAQPGTMGLIAFTQLVATTYNSFARQFLVRQPQ